ncbi:bifunctional diguanylate cyclase/phosphodiesterase [Micromonospora avicenniae]|uniref:EAL domain, c-di-GMP-specific phosphodiesterase class I (Or its enzymatically inactive variant) n=1 Tax=Micromonospora avicenniae TaxID=1198245 RepID=A0A1N6Y5U8_9ACTN|nr:bifunctional diguanylate cyclase/phosphodiesterase [Micromonospora avicenniae]SIR09958.1 EAL domain, c-di-GMP-specific phosphodiesterase class I (or its enzymatically inactive variant) [Micromonospora avicenniae]
MPLAAPFRAPALRRAAPAAAVLAAVTSLVLAGAVHLLAAATVVALAGGAGATLAGVRLIRLAIRLPAPPDPHLPATGAPESASTSNIAADAHVRGTRRPSARRAVLLLHAAVTAAGLATAAPLLLGPEHRVATAAGSVLAAASAVLGLRALPGRSLPPVRVRLRRLVDAGTPAVALVLAGWLLLPRAAGPAPARFAVAALLGALGIIGLTALTGVHRRPGTATCRGGVTLTLLGLVLLAVFDPAVAAWPLLLAVPPLLVGMLLVAAGAARAVAAEPAPLSSAPAWLRAAPAGESPSQATAAVPAALVAAPVPPMLDGLADGPALLRALTVLGGNPPPAGALLVVELHLPDGDTAPRALRADVLAEAVRRARAVVGRRDLLAQVGEAGFAVVTEVGPMLAYALGDRLLAALTRPYQLGGAVFRVPASIGLAEVSGESPQDVLRQADLARRRAVQLGRDRVEWYDAFLEEQLVRRLDLERELPGAVARGELDLVYQPVLRLGDRRPVGTEAFLRWRSPVLGTVLPDELFPVAADLDIAGELEWWVLDRACRQVAEWTASSRQPWMAVNVTTGELTTPDFVQRTAAVLAAYGVPPEQLVVEVSEPRIGVELSTVVARLAGLRSVGVRTALDDFRAEHASLAQLRRLPIDLLKVGAPLVDPAPDTQRPLIDVVVNVGDRLGLEVVAEDLESAAQVRGARRAGCRYGQGFALARPATAERVEAYFEEFPSASR